MSLELTERILSSLKGYLDITVTHPDITGKLVVVGAAVSGLNAPWRDMPEEMKVNRTVYCCQQNTLRSLAPVFVFADDVTVVDAPAYLVVGRMLDMMYESGLDEAVERLEDPEEVLREEDED